MLRKMVPSGVEKVLISNRESVWLGPRFERFIFLHLYLYQGKSVSVEKAKVENLEIIQKLCQLNS